MKGRNDNEVLTKQQRILDLWLDDTEETAMTREQEMLELSKPAAPSKRKPLILKD